MTASRHTRERELFLEARGLPPERRATFLASACGDDTDLRGGVEELLRHDRPWETLVLGPPPFSERSRPPSTLPPDLLWAGVRRLRAIGILLPITLVLMWVVPVTLAGRMGQELRDPWQWAPPVTAMLASALVVWATLRWRSAQRVLGLGLAYEVVVAYALVAGQYWGSFAEVPGGVLDFDVVGFSAVVPWMLLYAVLVPARPTRALPALVLAASAPPVLYALTVQAGVAPHLSGSRFFYAFVFPNVAAVGFAWFAISVVYGLGRAVEEAREVGAYRLDEPLGEGAMGTVWRARHRLLARPAAIKLVRKETLGTDPDAVAIALERFETEARTTASLRSPHTVELYDFGRATDGSLYYAMELLDGIDLYDMVRRFGPLPPGRAVHLAQQVCSSLAEAHGMGLIHRDIKPANLFVCRQGVERDVLKVLDFGLVRPVTSAEEAGTGGIEGTPAFMAPEATVAGGSGIDPRSDLYGLGAVLYWMLTGRAPVEAATLAGLLAAKIRDDPSRPSGTGVDVPASLDDLVVRCLARKPEDRPESAEALRTALTSDPGVPPWTREDARRWWAEHDV